ncbi:MAG TPA: DUF4097 family beta strand repeat-containing protein [Longimicrobium sp.]|nr:DUF4097 family beta strand repeat-containing protein [Longimicrobium sp.]
MSPRIAVPLLLLAGLACAGSAHAQQVERFELRDSRVALYNVAGEVRLEAGTGSSVVVEVTRGGGDARQLRIERGDVGGKESLRVVYPDERIIYPRMGRGSNTQFSVRRDGTFGGRIGLTTRRVRVAGSGSGAEAWADLRVRVPAGQSLEVHQGVGRVFVTNVDGTLQLNGASASVKTEGTRGSLAVDVGSGGVEVDGASGNVNIDTGSGGVRVNAVRGDNLHVDTGSGGVTGNDVQVRSLLVNVGSGGVRIAGVRARDVEVDTGSGSVDLGLLADADRVKIDTGSGGVTLSVPDDFGAELVIDTGSGGITVDVPVSDRTSRRSRFTGRVGDGNGRVSIDTGSGGVRLKGRD